MAEVLSGEDESQEPSPSVSQRVRAFNRPNPDDSSQARVTASMGDGDSSLALRLIRSPPRLAGTVNAGNGAVSFDSNESIHEAKNNADGAANENTNAVKIVVEKDSNLEESRSTKSRNSFSLFHCHRRRWSSVNTSPSPLRSPIRRRYYSFSFCPNSQSRDHHPKLLGSSLPLTSVQEPCLQGRLEDVQIASIPRFQSGCLLGTSRKHKDYPSDDGDDSNPPTQSLQPPSRQGLGPRLPTSANRGKKRKENKIHQEPKSKKAADKVGGAGNYFVKEGSHRDVGKSSDTDERASFPPGETQEDLEFEFLQQELRSYRLRSSTGNKPGDDSLTLGLPPSIRPSSIPIYPRSSIIHGIVHPESPAIYLPSPYPSPTGRPPLPPPPPPPPPTAVMPDSMKNTDPTRRWGRASLSEELEKFSLKDKSDSDDSGETIRIPTSPARKFSGEEVRRQLEQGGVSRMEQRKREVRRRAQEETLVGQDDEVQESRRRISREVLDESEGQAQEMQSCRHVEQRAFPGPEDRGRETSARRRVLHEPLSESGDVSLRQSRRPILQEPQAHPEDMPLRELLGSRYPVSQDFRDQQIPFPLPLPETGSRHHSSQTADRPQVRPPSMEQILGPGTEYRGSSHHYPSMTSGTPRPLIDGPWQQNLGRDHNRNPPLHHAEEDNRGRIWNIGTGAQHHGPPQMQRASPEDLHRKHIDPDYELALSLQREEDDHADNMSDVFSDCNLGRRRSSNSFSDNLGPYPRMRTGTSPPRRTRGIMPAMKSAFQVSEEDEDNFSEDTNLGQGRTRRSSNSLADNLGPYPRMRSGTSPPPTRTRGRPNSPPRMRSGSSPSRIRGRPTSPPRMRSGASPPPRSTSGTTPPLSEENEDYSPEDTTYNSYPPSPPMKPSKKPLNCDKYPGNLSDVPMPEDKPYVPKSRGTAEPPIGIDYRRPYDREVHRRELFQCHNFELENDPPSPRQRAPVNSQDTFSNWQNRSAGKTPSFKVPEYTGGLPPFLDNGPIEILHPRWKIMRDAQSQSSHPTAQSGANQDNPPQSMEAISSSQRYRSDSQGRINRPTTQSGVNQDTSSQNSSSKSGELSPFVDKDLVVLPLCPPIVRKAKGQSHGPLATLQDCGTTQCGASQGTSTQSMDNVLHRQQRGVNQGTPVQVMENILLSSYQCIQSQVPNPVDEWRDRLTVQSGENQDIPAHAMENIPTAPRQQLVSDTEGQPNGPHANLRDRSASQTSEVNAAKYVGGLSPFDDKIPIVLPPRRSFVRESQSPTHSPLASRPTAQSRANQDTPTQPIPNSLRLQLWRDSQGQIHRATALSAGANQDTPPHIPQDAASQKNAASQQDAVSPQDAASSQDTDSQRLSRDVQNRTHVVPRSARAHQETLPPSEDAPLPRRLWRNAVKRVKGTSSRDSKKKQPEYRNQLVDSIDISTPWGGGKFPKMPRRPDPPPRVQKQTLVRPRQDSSVSQVSSSSHGSSRGPKPYYLIGVHGPDYDPLKKTKPKKPAQPFVYKLPNPNVEYEGPPGWCHPDMERRIRTFRALRDSLNLDPKKHRYVLPSRIFTPEGRKLMRKAMMRCSFETLIQIGWNPNIIFCDNSDSASAITVFVKAFPYKKDSPMIPKSPRRKRPPPHRATILSTEFDRPFIHGRIPEFDDIPEEYRRGAYPLRPEYGVIYDGPPRNRGVPPEHPSRPPSPERTPEEEAARIKRQAHPVAKGAPLYVKPPPPMLPLVRTLPEFEAPPVRDLPTDYIIPAPKLRLKDRLHNAKVKVEQAVWKREDPGIMEGMWRREAHKMREAAKPRYQGYDETLEEERRKAELEEQARKKEKREEEERRRGWRKD